MCGFNNDNISVKNKKTSNSKSEIENTINYEINKLDIQKNLKFEDKSHNSENNAEHINHNFEINCNKNKNSGQSRLAGGHSSILKNGTMLNRHDKNTQNSLENI